MVRNDDFNGPIATRMDLKHIALRGKKRGAEVDISVC